jgi:redox-sensitive bicupin YhaK (pirin superfamily)
VGTGFRNRSCANVSNARGGRHEKERRVSFLPDKDPAAGNAYQCDAIAHVVVPRTVGLGDGFSVRRALPSARSRMVGPFIFFDHFGPAEFRAGKGLDVRPHPHIGLATVTYLFDGEIMHRDSLGTAAPIKPGEVNWMTAGRGIVHSERTGPELRSTGSPIHGLQIGWRCRPPRKRSSRALRITRPPSSR